MSKKISEHPTSKLLRKIEELEKQVKALEVDLAVVRDLLLRTVRLVAKLEKESPLKRNE